MSVMFGESYKKENDIQLDKSLELNQSESTEFN